MEITKRKDNKYETTFEHFSGHIETKISPFEPFSETREGTTTLYIPFFDYTLIYESRGIGDDQYFVKTDLVHKTIKKS